MEEIIYKLVFQVTYQTLKPLLAFLHHDSFLYWPFILSTLLIAMLAWRFTRARGDLDPTKPHWKEFFDRYLSRRRGTPHRVLITAFISSMPSCFR